MGKGAFSVKLPVFCSMLLFSAVANFGGVIRFIATTEHTNVVPGEQIAIAVELVTDKSIPNLSAPSVPPNDAFDVTHTEQNQSSSTSIQIINGKVSNTKEVHYQFSYTIVPKKSGVFTFPALQVMADNAPFRTEPITFNAGAAPAKNPDIRVSIVLSKQPLYIGEQAILTLKVASRGNSPVQVDQGFTAAVGALEKSFGKDFSVSRLFTNQVTSSSERIGGEMCRTFLLRWAIIPLSGGTYTIPAVPFGYAELKQVRRRSRDPFFDDFFSNDIFGSGVQAVSRTAFSNEIVLRVKELPPPPADFSGSIGKIGISAVIDPASVPAGEAATLKIAVSAATRPGNVTEITAPKLTNCEIFTPEKHVQVDTTPGGITTKKVYKFLLIPQKEGTLEVPPIILSYFDPYEGIYKTASSGSLSIMVTPGKAGIKPQTRYLTQEEIREIGSDIRYIKTNAKLRSFSEKPYREPLFFLLYPLPFLIFIIALLYRLQTQHREINAAQYVRARAHKEALKRFEQLRRHGSKLQSAQFLGSVAETIERYISQKFGFTAIGRTLEELKNELLSRNAEEQVVLSLTHFIELLDSYRFGGVKFDETTRSAVRSQAMAFIANLEKTVKKEKKGSPSKVLATAVTFLLMLIWPAFSAPVNSWFEQANHFYSKAQYDSAVAYYDKIISAGTTSPPVYFNLGNAYFRLKKLGYARLCYEKARGLDPADPDIATNIKFVSSNIVDRVPEPQRGFIETVFWRLHILLPLRVQIWVCFALLLIIASIASAALYTEGNKRLWLLYTSSLITLILLLIGSSMAFKIYDSENNVYAILLEPSVDAKNEPEGTKILFTAHEGTKFQIRKTVEGWSLVSLPNGASGWVENKYIGKI
jgi:tetratricopeptide (TPR) repeat protein